METVIIVNRIIIGNGTVNVVLRNSITVLGEAEGNVDVDKEKAITIYRTEIVVVKKERIQIITV